MSRYSMDNTSASTSLSMPSIDLDLLSLERPSSRASSSSSSTSGVYIPVHRRKLSNTSSASSVSSVPSSPASSMSSFANVDVPIYSVEDLILMSHSPLAHLADEDRSHMREIAPEIYLSGRRKQKGRMEQRGKQSSADGTSSRKERKGRRSTGSNVMGSWRRS